MNVVGASNIREYGAPVGMLNLDTIGASAVYSTVRPNVQQKPLSTWKDENVADGY